MAYYEDIIYDSNNELICKLCLVSIKNSNCGIEAHINEDIHRELEFKRILSENSVVTYNNRIKCNVCDSIINESFETHILNSSHRVLLETIRKMVKTDGNFLKFPKRKTERELFLSCLLCDQFLDFNLRSVTNHLSTSKHKRARAIAVQPYNGICSVEGSNDYLWCKFCQVYFDNYLEIIFEHVDEDADHITKVTKILNLIKNQNISIEKYLMDPKEDKAQCLKCDTSVSCNVDNLERHIKGKLHKK